MSALDLKIPPVVVIIAFGVLMWAGVRLSPEWRVAFSGQRWLAGVTAGAGVLIAFLGVAAFRQARTTVNPTKPENTSALVAHGIYRRTRNPMYLGMLLALIAWTVWLGHPLAFAGPILFVAYMTRFQIVPEERMLMARFGDEFAAYQRRVRRWI